MNDSYIKMLIIGLCILITIAGIYIIIRRENNKVILGLILVVIGLGSSTYFSKTILGDEIIKPYTFYDDFSMGNRYHWTLGHNDSASAVIENKQLVLSNRCVGATRRTYRNINIDPRKNFTIETTASKLEGDANTGYGITWGSNDSGYYHGFVINSDTKYYSIGTLFNKKFKFIKSWAHCDAINEEQENKLAIIKQGDSLSFYINNSFVDKEPSPDFFGPFVGAFVNQAEAEPDSERKAAFKYFKITGTLMQ